jgi:hypothetical protein
MQALKKIEEHTIALSKTSALLDELESLGPGLAENADKQAALLADFKLLRAMTAEVTSLAQHMQLDKDIHMASLHFQQASVPLLTRFQALTEMIGPMRSLPTSSASTTSNQRREQGGSEKASKRVSLSGWLKKKGEGALSNSHRRYFMLDQSAPTQLRYYETDTLQKQKGYIPLDQMEAVLINDGDTTMFGIKTKERVWMLQADSEHDARIWIKCLSKWGERFQLQQHKNAARDRELAEGLAGSATGQTDRQVPDSPRSTANDSNTLLNDGSSGGVDEELLKIQQEAERRELLRQQESSRRWKEKQELRFQREAARLKDEAQARWLQSSESHDTTSSAPPSGQSSNPGQGSGGSHTGPPSNDGNDPSVPQISFPSDGSTPPSSTSLSQSSSSNTLNVPGSPHRGTSGDSSAPSSARLTGSKPASGRIDRGETTQEDKAKLKERLKAALKLKRDRTVIIADLLRQKQLFVSLQQEKLAEIKKLEDADASVVQLREMRDESVALAKHLSASIQTYKQQILEQDKLVGLIQSTVKQNTDKAAQIQTEIDAAEEELASLEPSFTTLSLTLSNLAVSRMIAHAGMKSPMEVEDKIEVLAEQMKAQEDLARLTRNDLESREREHKSKVADRKIESEQLQQSLDTTRHTFQFLRSLLNTDAGYSFQEELEDLRHDYFVSIVNGIKLNLIQEGHTLKLTSPSLLYAQAKSEGVRQQDWPHWISSFLHTRCIESSPGPIQRQQQHGNHSMEEEGHAAQDEGEAIHQAPRRQRKKRRNMTFGASLGANFGGGGLMMM